MTSSLKIVNFLEKLFFTNTFLYKCYECVYDFRFIAAVVVKLFKLNQATGQKAPPAFDHFLDQNDVITQNCGFFGKIFFDQNHPL